MENLSYCDLSLALLNWKQLEFKKVPPVSQQSLNSVSDVISVLRVHRIGR